MNILGAFGYLNAFAIDHIFLYRFDCTAKGMDGWMSLLLSSVSTYPFLLGVVLTSSLTIILFSIVVISERLKERVKLVCASQCLVFHSLITDHELTAFAFTCIVAMEEKTSTLPWALLVRPAVQRTC